jgi:3,4-dihydroxy 2-butanone 4-phosphate synthase/GTP cyclohydrolase II
MAIHKVAEAALPTKFGTFRIHGFESESADESVVALVMGEPWKQPSPLIRIHSQCLTGENFGSSRCDCGEQLIIALEKIAEEGEGILIYQLAEGRGIGLMNKLLAYELQDSGHDTVEANHQLGFEADPRSYALCGAVLASFGIRRIRLMSNNPRKLAGLEQAGIEQIERVPIEIPPSVASESYLRTKKDKLGHLLSEV